MTDTSPLRKPQPFRTRYPRHTNPADLLAVATVAGDILVWSLSTGQVLETGRASVTDGAIVSLSFDRTSTVLHVVSPHRLSVSSPVSAAPPEHGKPRQMTIKSVKALPSAHSIKCFRISPRRPDLALVGLTNAMFFTYNVQVRRGAGGGSCAVCTTVGVAPALFAHVGPHSSCAR